MDGHLNDMEVSCCFCGRGLLLKDALIINVQANIESDETQQFFAHKKHFTEKIHPSIPVNPDFLDQKP